MKQKIKSFFIEKKELLIFIAAVTFVFIAVIAIASLAFNDNDIEIDAPYTSTTSTTSSTNVDNTPTIIPKEVVKFSLPIKDDYKVVRVFFDSTLSDSELVNAIIDNGTSIITSSGISYAKNDNSKFDVLSIYDGKVIGCEYDDLKGDSIIIRHSDNLVSIYSSLENINVSLNDEVKKGDVIACASTSIDDPSSGVHVHLQVKLNNEYINPNNIYGKELEEVIKVK